MHSIGAHAAPVGNAAAAAAVEKLSGIALGILAAIGGFVDIGAIVTATQAGAQYRFALLWTLIPGLVGLVLYMDMAGRVTVASGRTLFDAIRDRLGARLALLAMLTSVGVNVVTLAIEIAGMGLALQTAVHVTYLAWIPAAALLLLILIWSSPYGLLENGSAAIGCAMLVFVVALVKMAPPWREVGVQIVHPHMETVSSLSAYLFTGISLFGGYMTPFQFAFYSSGAVEEEWDGEDLLVNRITSFIGTIFGATISFAIIVTAGLVLFPQGSSADSISDVTQPVQVALGNPGWALLLVGVFGVGLGAAIEAALSTGYIVCQFFGWDWGKRGRPRETPLFTLTYAAAIAVALLIGLTGINPIKLTVLVMAFAAASLPFTFLPLLLVANDAEYMGEQKNTPAVNAAAIVILGLLLLVTIGTVPLLILTGGGA